MPQLQHIRFYELEEGEELDTPPFKPPLPLAPKPAYSVPVKSDSEPKQNTSPAYISLAAAYVAAHQSYAERNSLELGSSFNSPLSLCAIDCEMCETASGMELTRFSLVSIPHGVLIDTLVQPPIPIVNYWTEFSGIDESSLSGVTTTIEDIHALLRNYNVISPDTIVVGHSIDSDLRAARLIHEFVVDTSIIYHHDKGYPHKHSLKYLSQKYLGKSIQIGDRGHNSVEDAIATIELAVLNLSNKEAIASSWVKTEKTNLYLSTFSTPNIEASGPSSQGLVRSEKFEYPEFVTFCSDNIEDCNGQPLNASGRYALGYKPESNVHFAMEYARRFLQRNNSIHGTSESTSSIFRYVCTKNSTESLLRCQQYWKTQIQSEEKRLLMWLNLRLDISSINTQGLLYSFVLKIIRNIFNFRFLSN